LTKAISYKIGYFLADKPKLRIALFVGIFVAAVVATYPSNNGATSAAHQAQNSEKKPEFGCAGQRLANYQKLMQEKAFWEASLQVAPCETLNDGNNYQELRREAEKKHYENEIAVSKNDLARKYKAVDKLIDERHPVSTELAQQSRRYYEAELKKAAAAEAKFKKSRGVQIGMTEADVLASSWGKPRRINTTTRASGESAQWVYNGSYLYFKNGILETIQN
jgi:hypothetical protein